MRAIRKKVNRNDDKQIVKRFARRLGSETGAMRANGTGFKDFEFAYPFETKMFFGRVVDWQLVELRHAPLPGGGRASDDVRLM